VAKGLLLVTMEPPASLEEEFNDWYDSEHLPQRCGLPGFENGSRWVCISGWPRWLAIYDLVSTDVLAAAAYQAVSGTNSTPWSRRILPRTIGRQRVVAQQIEPGDAPAPAPDRVGRLALARFHGRPDGLAAAIAARNEASGQAPIRLFDDGATFWALAPFPGPVDAGRAAAILSNGDVQPVLLNLYAPYRR